MKETNWQFPDLTAARQPAKGPSAIIRSNGLIDPIARHLGDDKFYCVKTYGCQANFRNHETMCGLIEAMGYQPAESLEKADLIILNTCAIRDNAQRKVLGELGNLKHLKKEKPQLLIGLGGCMAQQPEVAHKLADDLPFVDFVFGTHNICELPTIIAGCQIDKQRQIKVYSKPGEIYEGLPVKRQLKHKAWVEIMDGCDKFCTYCIVPYTRGRQRSRLLTDIIAEVVSLKENGCQEVTLLGQNVNAYGKDLAETANFAQLLTAVAETGIPRVRFMTSHPWDFTPEMVTTISQYANIMPAVHLPVQSGNNDILKLMGRRYTVESYLKLYDDLKAARQDIAITTDIIVGFPGETNSQFNDTLALYDRCKFDNAYTFIFSPRPGTPASIMDDPISADEKKERLTKLNEKVDLYSKQANLTYNGQTVKVLVDGTSKSNKQMLCGYEPHNKLVNFINKDSHIGDIIDVSISAAMKNSLNGTQQQ